MKVAYGLFVKILEKVTLIQYNIALYIDIQNMIVYNCNVDVDDMFVNNSQILKWKMRIGIQLFQYNKNASEVTVQLLQGKVAVFSLLV